LSDQTQINLAGWAAQVDPSEYADALRDAMLTGGATPHEADAEAETEWQRLTSRTAPTDSWSLVREEVPTADHHQAAADEL
jgi:hypothetical protein